MDVTRSAKDNSGEAVDEGVTMSSRLFLLLISGFVLVFVGIAVIVVASALYCGGSVSGGVVIFIGPFPIVVGAGPDVSLIILVSVILAVLSVVVFLVMNRRMRRVDD
jgi:uncharacterized membrane protein